MITFLVISNTFFLWVLGVYCVYCLTAANQIMKAVNTDGSVPSKEEQREFHRKLRVAAFCWPILLPFKIW